MSNQSNWSVKASQTDWLWPCAGTCISQAFHVTEPSKWADNVNADAAFLRTLDSAIKRNTAVIKKLKQINEEQQEGLLEELRSVNLSKFVTEAVTAICDAKLRTSDINAAVQVMSICGTCSF